MIWTRQQLLELSEADFRDQVVIPLFKAMGFQEVRSHHGGVLEQGKDVVMYRVNEFGTRRNVALVVKAERISGSASTLASTALTQIQQAFGTTFLDPVTREEHRVHEVKLVNSHDISEEALTSYGSALRGASRDHLVDFVWGDGLWTLLRKHVPKFLVFDSIAEAQKALSESDPHYGYVVQVGPRRTQFIVIPRSADAPIPELSFEPNFPDTEEGRQQLAAFERFLRTGERVEIDRRFLAVRGLPPSSDLLLGAFDSGTIHLGPSASAERLVVALKITPPGAPEVVLMPYVEFGTNRSGTEEVTLSNEQQATPFKLVLTIRRSEAGVFTYNFSEATNSAFTHHQAVLIQDHLSRGGMLSYQNLQTGVRHDLFELRPGEVKAPGDGYVELWAFVAEIQRVTDTLIPAPERVHFTEEDVAATLKVLSIVREGHLNDASTTLTLGMTAEGVRKLVEAHEDGRLVDFQLGWPEHVERVLDTDVPLGPVQVKCPLARVHPDSIAAARETLARGCSPETSIPLIIEAIEGHSAELVFPRWIPSGKSEASNVAPASSESSAQSTGQEQPGEPRP